MANSYTQIHIHAVSVVKFRRALIDKEWNHRLHQYIIAIVYDYGHRMIAINSMPDHLHLLFGFRPSQSLSDLMRIVKSESSGWINKQKLTSHFFRWQEGFGAFSCGKSEVQRVAAYIENQERHHRSKTFDKEYVELLEQHGVDFDKKYLFHAPSD